MSGAQVFQVQQPTVQIIPPKKVSKVLSVIAMVGSTVYKFEIPFKLYRLEFHYFFMVYKQREGLIPIQLHLLL